MITVNVKAEKTDLEALINLARREPVLILAPDGKEFFLAEADDFEKEVEELRASPAFQKFLDERQAAPRRTVSLDEIEQEIDQELAQVS